MDIIFNEIVDNLKMLEDEAISVSDYIKRCSAYLSTNKSIHNFKHEYDHIVMMYYTHINNEFGVPIINIQYLSISIDIKDKFLLNRNRRRSSIIEDLL